MIACRSSVAAEGLHLRCAVVLVRTLIAPSCAGTSTFATSVQLDGPVQLAKGCNPIEIHKPIFRQLRPHNLKSRSLNKPFEFFNCCSQITDILL